MVEGIKKIFDDKLIYINSGLIFLLIIFCISCFVKISNINHMSVNGPEIQSSGDVLDILQKKLYANIDETSKYVVGITSSKNVKFYMEDPSLLQWPGTAIEKNAKMDEASGIFLWNKWYVITNKHVVENSEAKYAVVFYDGSTYDVDKIWQDKQLDLAILKINIGEKYLKEKNINKPEFLDANQSVELGKIVLAVGKKWENNTMLGFGIISSKNKKLTINNENLYVNLYQVNFLLQPWFSGSPLVDIDGKVIGINTAVSQLDLESFVLPISNQLISSSLKSIERYWKIMRWLVWIKYDEINDNKELQKKLNLTGGVFVRDILPELPAFNAWIQVNDIIVSINDVLISKNMPFVFQIYNYLPWDKLKLQVLRNNSLIDIDLVLGENS